MNTRAKVERVVVIHGPADPGTVTALTAVGLALATRLGDTEVWAPSGMVEIQASTQVGAGLESGRLLTIDQAAVALGLGRTTTRKLIRTGQLETVSVGRSVRVPTDAVDDLIDRLRRRRRKARDMRPSASHAGGTIKVLGRADASQRSAASSDSPPSRRQPVKESEPDACPEAS